MQVPAKSEITIRDVMNFTCGIKDIGKGHGILPERIVAMAGSPRSVSPGKHSIMALPMTSPPALLN
jgi:hypothetical protein